MKSRYVLFPAPNTVELHSEEVAGDGLACNEVLIRNECSMISAGTELACLRGEGEAAGKFPSRSGYASIGRVLAAGPGSRGVAVGDRVFYSGRHAEVQRFQHGQDHQWGICYPVPEQVAPEDAPFGCLAQVAQVAPWTAPAEPGDTVAVFGLGVIGNLCAQLYRAMGARVIGLDPVAERCALARRCGIAETCDCPPAEQAARVRELTGGQGADLTVEAVGHSAVAMTAVEATRVLGRCVLLGTPRQPMTGDLTAMFSRLHLQGIALLGALNWRFPATAQRGVQHTVADAYRICFQMMLDGRLVVEPLRSHLVKPEEAPAMYRMLQDARDRAWGVIIDWRKP